MPSLTFVLPHWLYWIGLLGFPLVAMYIVRRPKPKETKNRANIGLALLFWLCGGFVGLHRFYLRSMLGAVYIPFFVTILHANAKVRIARDGVSAARNDLMNAEFQIEHWAKRIEDGVESAKPRLEAAKEMAIGAKQQFADATGNFDWWQSVALVAFSIIVAFMIVDLILLSRMVRACAEREAAEGLVESALDDADLDTITTATHEKPALALQTPVTNVIDRISGFTGEFVAYWSLIAVFVYYYEVVARYVFNSPTNWAHESMFLMFGMQYLIAGAYALREDSHIRVDVIYAHLPKRWQVITDVVTSVFFFIFTVTLLVTGWIFMRDSVAVWEVSFTEWAIQYWPVKMTIAAGAILLILQGIAHLIKDVRYLLSVNKV